MEDVLATCPVCHATHPYGGELVGRYTFCRGCRARFYVEVPTLGEPKSDQPITRPATAKPDMTLDDLLWDTQLGTRFIIESLRRHEASARATRWLMVAMIVVGLANLAGFALLFLQRTN